VRLRKRTCPAAAAVLAGFLLGGCHDVGQDPGPAPTAEATPPEAVVNLTASARSVTSLELSWTAPGGDGADGAVRRYDLRWTTGALDDGTFEGAAPLTGVPDPAPAGTTQSFMVSGLLPGTTYRFAIKSVDLAANWSRISNVAQGTTDRLPPGPEGFVQVPAGTFVMGSPADEPGRYTNETQRTVTLTGGFYISDHLVTQAEWTAIMGWNEAQFSGDDQPEETVTWFDCVNYCNLRSQKEGLPPAYAMADVVRDSGQVHINSATVTWNRGARGYRLPTEAEWEYACRAGSAAAFGAGPITHALSDCGDDPVLDRLGWYCGNSDSHAHPVKQLEPNVWGLYDMHGDVWEWCWDWFALYPAGPATDPIGPASGSARILRGGSWGDNARSARCAHRDTGVPGYDANDCGFRVVRNAP